MQKPELNFETAGDPNSPALMLLHGFMSSNPQWLLNVDALAEQFFLVMVELWGHGQSPAPDNACAYSIDAYLQQFEQIRTSLDIHQWSAAGQSYGAGLVVNYAIAHPESVSAVIVTNSRSAFGQLDDTPRTAPADTANTNDQSDFDPRSLPYHPIHARRFPEQVKQALVTNADTITPATVKLGGALGAQLNCIEQLGQVTGPVLLTNGVYEKSFQADAERLRNLYPDLRIANLQGGHSVNIEAADGFNQAVLQFLHDHNTANQGA